MFLSKKKNNGYVYLYLLESVYDPVTKRARTVVVKNYGRWDKLDEETKNKYLEPKAKKELEQKLEQEQRLKELQNAGVAVDEQLAPEAPDNSNFNKAQALCYGHIALKGIWDRELDLRKKITNLQSYHREISSWSLNDVIFYLCATKVISPGSYLGASNGRANYLYCPWQYVTQDNFYKTLDFVYEFRDKLIQHAVKSHLQHKGERIKVAFFDCTNTYFETPYDDVTKQTIEFTALKRQEKMEEGLSDEEINKYLKSEVFLAELEEELESRADEVLRMRGPSKESRFNQPIVTVALAINQEGFPIDCEVYAGNTSELKAVSPMLSSLKQKYEIEDVYFVADRGLNSTESIRSIKEEKLGFVVAQKVSKQKASERKEMLDLDGYQLCKINDEGDFVADNSGLSVTENSYRYKVCNHTKSSYIPNTDKDAKFKTKKVSVDCKIIYTFSPKRRDRDLADLKTQIAKANAAVANKQLMGNPNSSGWRSLVETKKEAARNKIEKDQYRAVGVKDEVIAERTAIAGYSAVVYDAPDCENKTELTAEQVLKTYHRLVAIEDCFRVMKSTFSIRPVYVRLRERIIAHCYLCVLSLMLMRCVQNALEVKNIYMSSERVSKALKQALVVPIPSKTGKATSFLNVGLDPKYHTLKRDKPGRKQSELDNTVDQQYIWEQYCNERESQPDDLDQILNAVNLKPLKLFNPLSEIKTCLNLRTCTDDVMLAYEQRQMMAKLCSTL